jgi:hypothetical protein
MSAELPGLDKSSVFDPGPQVVAMNRFVELFG